MSVGKRIKERRKELNMSVDELAKKLNKNRTTIYRYEKGDIENLPLDLLEPLAKALDTTPEHLMGWTAVDAYMRENKDFADYIRKYKPDLQQMEKWHIMLQDYLPLTDDENEKLMHYVMYLISLRDDKKKSH